MGEILQSSPIIISEWGIVMAKYIALTEDTRYDKQNVLFHIVVIGVGANGSHFLRGLLQDISTHQNWKEIDLTIVDADRVEEKNLSNQLFTNDEIGEFKVRALAERYGQVYNVDVKAVTHYCTDLDMLRRLFIPGCTSRKVIPILIGMVDNNKTRQLFHEFFYLEEVTDLIWLDAGVEGITIPERPIHQLSDEERISLEQTGYSGQIVCGLKWRGKVVLPPVTDVYSNILEDTLTSFPGESCGTLIINNPQRCATNKFAAQIANNFMNNLFHLRAIFWSINNFNAQLSVSRPVYLTEDQINTWIKCNAISE